MKSKFSILTVLFLFVIICSNAFNPVKNITNSTPVANITTLDKMITNGGNSFLTMTPKEFQKLTGKKLSVTEVIKMKAAQKALKMKMKKSEGDYSKGLFILLAILGWAWLLMGISDGWSGNNWWVNLLLTMLCGIPGLIHSLIKMKEYTR